MHLGFTHLGDYDDPKRSKKHLKPWVMLTGNHILFWQWGKEGRDCLREAVKTLYALSKFLLVKYYWYCSETNTTLVQYYCCISLIMVSAERHKTMVFNIYLSS